MGKIVNIRVASQWCLVVLVAILVRVLVSIHPHSGEGVPPMFGDFEAQRHWKELTIALPIGDWYRNTSQNDLLYWGLDYPPLTAYHSYAVGKVASYLHPNMVAFHTSHGNEEPLTKWFMRASALLADVVIYIPAVLFAYRCVSNRNDLNIEVWFPLLVPALLIIDHGHFQYNGISVGLAMIAMACILKGKDVIGSICFCLALNYKQMCLYMAPAFFFFLLRRSFDKGGVVACTKHILTLGITVLCAFGMLWLPFCLFHAPQETCATSLLHTLTRLFPFNRGIFEDKVSNLWYVLSIVYDFRETFSQQQLSMMSVGSTLILLAPSAIDILRRRSSSREAPKRFLLALVNSSLAFFLASFQVHEKSLLLALVPASFLLPYDPVIVGWFQGVGIFSMYPLIARDNLQLAYVAVLCIYLSVWLMFMDKSTITFGFTNNKRITWTITTAIMLSMLVIILLHVSYAVLPPPSRYPDLYPALISIFCASNLFLMFIYTNICQWLVE